LANGQENWSFRTCRFYKIDVVDVWTEIFFGDYLIRQKSAVFSLRIPIELNPDATVDFFPFW